MKNYSLKPTNEIVFELLVKDPLGRFQSVLRFLTLLSHMEDDCYSIALNGEWGSGKTFFVKQIKMMLDAYNPHSSLSDDMRKNVMSYEQEKFIYPTNYTTVYYDAWFNDNHVDPILSLIYATISSCQSSYSVEQERSLGNIVAAIADAVTGRNISDILKSLQGEDRLVPIKEIESLKPLLKDFFDTLIIERGDRLVFFIDELDRCKPDYAIGMLERIKHYFDDERVTFIFSISLSQLQHTVNRFYGSGFDATRYLDKFFDLRISLPPINYDRYLEQRFGINGHGIIDIICIETAKYFNFSLRETERYIRQFRIARKAADSIASGYSEQNAVLFSVIHFIPIILGLQMSNMDSFANFISGKDCGPLLDILLNPNIKIHMSWLINRGEEYDQTDNIFKDQTGATISLGDRLKEVYSALFTRTQNSRYGETLIGNLRFSENTRRVILEIAALLSPHSDYEFS